MNTKLRLLPQAIDRAADRAANHEGVRCRDQSLSYEELVQRSNTLAHMLVDQGVKRGDRVGIYMNKCVECATAIYGIMKAGAAYVPLDPTAPRARLLFVIRDCGIRHLITHENKQEDVKTLVKDIPELDCVLGVGHIEAFEQRVASWQSINETRSNSTPDVGILEDDLCYILYTSGSTGHPKGIMHTHRSALSFAEMAAKTYGFQPTDRMSNHAPLHFDLSTLDYFGVAVASATTVIIPEEYTKFPASLSKLMEKEKLTILYTVPFAMIQLLLHGALDTRELGSLRWMLFGGEPFPVKHLRQLMKCLPDAQFCNVYGPTETNGCTHYLVPPLSDDSDEPIPIGKLYDNVKSLVLDEKDKPVPSGETGELFICAPTLMRGYWNQPKMNEQAFYQRTSQPGIEDIYHRTGDLVQEQPDGNLRFIGRKDRQIKTRGHRVELNEIENALLLHGNVKEAAVFPVPDKDGSQLIEATVILKTDRDTDSAALSQHLATRLPWYALPRHIEVVNQFPRTSTDKIDRRQLQTLALERVSAPTTRLL